MCDALLIACLLQASRGGLLMAAQLPALEAGDGGADAVDRGIICVPVAGVKRMLCKRVFAYGCSIASY